MVRTTGNNYRHKTNRKGIHQLENMETSSKWYFVRMKIKISSTNSIMSLLILYNTANGTRFVYCNIKNEVCVFTQKKQLLSRGQFYVFLKLKIPLSNSSFVYFIHKIHTYFMYMVNIPVYIYRYPRQTKRLFCTEYC